jgi:uncharacterized protein
MARLINYLLALVLLGWMAHSLWFYALPRTQLKIGLQPLQVAVADTPRRQAWGLMFRFALQDGDGMLFVNRSPRKMCMWMKNTFIPLSVAFLREDGSIASLDDMQPLTRRRHCALEPVSYALEVPQGWFAKNRIAAGSVVAGLPDPAR